MGCELNITFDRPVAFVMPGHGDDCGKRGWKYRACPERVHYVRFPLSCHGAQCPEHWRDWMNLEVARAYSRIERYLDIRRSQRLPSIVQHVIVSAPPELMRELPLWSTEFYSYMRWYVRRLLREVGIHGGWMVFHPHRIPDIFNDYTVHTDSFHWHLIAFGKIDPKAVSSVAMRTGWIIKGLGKRDDLRAVMRYILSHCGIPVRPVFNPANSKSMEPVGHTATWWGCVAYNALPKADVEDRPAIYCPGCRKYYAFRDWHCLEHRDEPPDNAWGILKPHDDWVFTFTDGEREAF